MAVDRNPDGHEVTPQGTYTTVFRTHSAVRLPVGQSLSFNMDRPDGPPDVFSFETAFGTRDGVGPWPLFLMAMSETSAHNVDAAMEDSFSVLNGLASILALASNASIGDLSLDVCYETTAHRTEREFFQYFVEMPPLDTANRVAPSEGFARLVPTIMGHAEQARIFRAVQQYMIALRYATPGDELGAIAHLWMAAEALTKVFLRREIEEHEGDEERLLAAWGIQRSLLDAEVRRRHVFGGDSELYNICKKASDAFEHGFRNFGDVLRSVKTRASEAFSLVRHAIFDAADVDAALLAMLDAAPYSKPLGLQPTSRQLRATIRGSSPIMAADGYRHPVVELESVVERIDHAPDGTMRVSSREKFRAHLSEGLEFADFSFSIAPAEDATFEELARDDGDTGGRAPGGE